jgi:hypothetical protein
MAGLSWDNREGVWLVDFDVHGRIFRWSTERATVTTNAGASLTYEAGLVSDLELGKLRSMTRKGTALQIESGEDWPLLEGRGARLEAQPVTVRLWYPGQTLEQARAYVVGRSEGVKHGEKARTLSMQVVEDSTARARDLPPTQAQATDETWPVNAGFKLAGGAQGQTIPVVIGYPGDHPKAGASADIAEAAIRLPYIERQDPYTNGTGDKYAVALGRIDAAQVQLYDYEGVTTQFAYSSPSTSVVTDGLGQAVTTVSDSLLNMPEDGEVWAGLRNASGWGGGLKSPYTGGVLRGAGEVMRYVLEYFTDERVDRGRMRAFQDWFDRFKVDAVIHERRNAVDWLTDNVLAFVPGVLVTGPDGVYVAPVRWDATELDAVAHLNADRHQVERTQDPKVWAEEVYNLFTLDYRPVRYGDRWASRRVLTATPGNMYGSGTGGAALPPFSSSLPWMATSEEDARIYGSALCRWSQAQSWGIREWTQQHPSCWDDHTAQQILSYKALKHGWQKRTISYRGGPELKTLEPMDVVTITDTPLRLSNAVALVVEPKVSTNTVDLDLLLLDHPFRVPRLTT